MFALIDCNNFYASCERVFNPNLQGKPVGILSNNDGCIISRSDEAKALGLPMGAPIFKWEAFCKQQNITILSSNYALYGDMSARVMKILEQFTPDVEVYSIDEAFLQFKGFSNYNLKDYGTQICNRVLKWTGIPTSIGIAPTKALSKVANKIARKNFNLYKGVCIIDSEETRINALKQTPLENVWGIGFNLYQKLASKGCKTAFDFTQLPDDWVRKTFSITLWRLKKELEGFSKINLEIASNKKAIATTRSFENTYSDLENIKERISTFAVSCSEKLRTQNSSCHVVMVFLRSDSHKKNQEQYRATKTVIFPYPTDSSLSISKAAMQAVETIFKQGVQYKKAGVIVMGIVPTNNHQLNIFFKEDPRHHLLMKSMDKLNQKYKSNTIKLASQDLKRTWKMKQERLSPKYTTLINDIIKVQ